MSNTQCSGLSSIDLAALENAVHTITNLEVRVDAEAVPIPRSMAEQAGRLRQLQWGGVLTRILPLDTEIEGIHRRCHELQTLLSDAKQTAEKTTEVPTSTSNTCGELRTQLVETNQTIDMQRQQIAAAASVNVADIREELEAGYNLARKEMFASHDQILGYKLEGLEERYREKEAELEA